MNNKVRVENNILIVNNEKHPVIFSVYGTLKKAHGNHRYRLDNAEFLGVHRTESNYTLFDGGFPIVERNGEVGVECELYKTDDVDSIDSVFNLEGCSKEQNNPNSWYTYDVIDTPHGKAIMFVMDKNKSGRTKTIENGVWGTTTHKLKEIEK